MALLTDLIGTPNVQITVEQDSINRLAYALVAVVAVSLVLWIIAKKIIK